MNHWCCCCFPALTAFLFDHFKRNAALICPELSQIPGLAALSRPCVLPCNLDPGWRSALHLRKHFHWLCQCHLLRESLAKNVEDEKQIRLNLTERMAPNGKGDRTKVAWTNYLFEVFSIVCKCAKNWGILVTITVSQFYVTLFKGNKIANGNFFVWRTSHL